VIPGSQVYQALAIRLLESAPRIYGRREATVPDAESSLVLLHPVMKKQCQQWQQKDAASGRRGFSLAEVEHHRPWTRSGRGSDQPLAHVDVLGQAVSATGRDGVDRHFHLASSHRGR